MVTSLVHANEAFTNEELVDWLRRRVGDGLLGVVDEAETLSVILTNDAYAASARLLKEEPRLAFTMFDCLFGVDEKEEGFDVIAILYSVETGRRVLIRTRCTGGRENPVAPTITDVFAGAMFHEREAWDMFGIEFDGNTQLAPRLLCDENFEGWPLRKDFHLATREAKPWPGVKEPAELDEDGNVIVKEVGIGEAVGPMPLDEIMAAQARAANPELVTAAEGSEAVATTPLGDDLKEEAEAVEAAALAETADELRDPDDVRAEAAQARADKAAEIAEAGPVGGDHDGEDVPQGDPSAFDAPAEHEEGES